ncbi:MAG: AbrB/MazE/SpoVT family DNA-binding domain-containing protein [Defluviitaleaceae bacterium]|nr:AbrB/MazE/SpoVT family DNA-binding domain-containing protein [Defluviitaleaceae bacterium]
MTQEMTKRAPSRQASQYVRAVDELGRIILPRTAREHQGIYPGDEFEIIMDGGNIILARHSPTCLACDDDTDVQKLNKTFLCAECREAVKKTL